MDAPRTKWPAVSLRAPGVSRRSWNAGIGVPVVLVMLRALLSQIQHRRGRAAAVAAGILVASVSFSLLTAATTTSTADVVGTVARNLRPAYDILVRPPGSTTALEASEGLVRDNYLSGIFGGITLQQYAQVKKIPGVQLAAPIAMLGYILESISLPVDVTGDLTSADAQVLTLTDTETTDRGLTKIPGRPAGYVYVTSDPIQGYALPTLATINGTQVFGATETLPSGKQITICPQDTMKTVASPFIDYEGRGWIVLVEPERILRSGDGTGAWPGGCVYHRDVSVSWSQPSIQSQSSSWSAWDTPSSMAAISATATPRSP